MSKQERLLLLSDLMLLAVAVVWGTSYGVVKSALVFYPVLGLLAMRFGITFVLLSPTLRHLRAADARTLRGVLSAGALLLGIFLCETFGILLTRAANAAFLISLCVVLTPLVEWWMLKRTPSRIEWGAVALSLLGAWLLRGRGTEFQSRRRADSARRAAARAECVRDQARNARLGVTAFVSDGGSVGRGSVRQRGSCAAVCAATVATGAVARRACDVLGLHRLSGDSVHTVRVLRAKLRDQTQQPDARVLANGQRTRVRCAVRVPLAR